MANWGAWGLGVLLLSVAPARAQEPRPGSALEDRWEVAYLEGVRVGFFRTTTRQTERDGRKLLHTTQEMNYTVRRYGDVSNLRMESGTVETAAGKVVGVSMRMPQPGGDLVLKGTRKDGVLHVEVDGGRIRRQIPWNDKVIGLYAQDHLFQKNKVKPGDKLTYRGFEPVINAVVTVQGTVHAEEEVIVLGVKKRLLRIILRPDKIEVPGASVQLPPVTVWLGGDGLPVRRQVELPGIGSILLTRSTRAQAQARVDLARLPDIGVKANIPLNVRIPRAQATSAIVYRVTVNDARPETALARDARQQVTNVDGKTFELHVKAVRAPAEAGKEEKAGDEFLKSCYYLDSNNGRVKELARKAVGTATDPWDRARRIERWVHANMRTDNGTAFAPAGQIAAQLRGDCRQHALLAAAMCRAAGVPSRTALGLIYVDRPGRPLLGYHMWFEVWVKGRWVALDAIVGQGSIGADHIKIADQSWHNTQSLTPLLPVHRVLGKMKIEVVSVEGER